MKSQSAFCVQEVNMWTWFVLSWLTGVCLGVEITQTPPDVLRNPGDDVQLVCSHGKTDYTYMQWYQRSPGAPALKRIGHVNYGAKEYEESFQTHFNFSGDLSGETAKNISLFVVDLKAEHTAVYYCAASYARRRETPDSSCKNSEHALLAPAVTSLPLLKPQQTAELSARKVDMIPLMVFCCLSGVCLSVKVDQSPPDLIVRPDAEVPMFCSHEKQDYRVMLWYQRSPGDSAMKLIGYLYYADPVLEEGYKDNFTIAGDLTGDGKKKGSLGVQVKGVEDNAVYYCAAREAHRQRIPRELYKNPSCRRIVGGFDQRRNQAPGCGCLVVFASSEKG